MFAARITGTGSAFPKHSVTNDDLAKKIAKLGVETNDQWIRERTGIGERRMSQVENTAEHNSSLGAIAAQKALDWGLVSYLYPEDSLLDEAQKLAQDISKMAPLAVRATKQIIKRGEGVDLMTQLQMETTQQSILARSDDFKEGISALMEKRDPQWKHK